MGAMEGGLGWGGGGGVVPWAGDKGPHRPQRPHQPHQPQRAHQPPANAGRGSGPAPASGRSRANGAEDRLTVRSLRSLVVSGPRAWSLRPAATSSRRARPPSGRPGADGTRGLQGETAC